MRTFLIRPYEGFGEVQADGLEDYYNLLECSTIDIVNRKIGNKMYDIICDDEALLKENAVISAYSKVLDPMLAGNLLICGEADEEGYLTSLTEEDVINIRSQIGVMFMETDNVMKPIVTLRCEYE